MDPNLLDLLSYALGPDATFHFCKGGEHPVLYYVHKGHDQLVQPSGGGFYDTVLQKLHDAPLGGYLGSAKTLEVVQACVWWPHMRADMEAYVAACPMCQRVKYHTTAKPGLLQPLLPPTERFICYTMDFDFGLPLCKGVNGIMTMVDRATKWVTLILIHESVTAAGAADLFLQWVVPYYGMLQEVIAYQDPHFMSAFWQ